MPHNCPLCDKQGILFFQDDKHTFHECTDCKGIFRDRQQLLNLNAERERYLHHKSDINDSGYYKFVSPLIKEVKNNFSKGNSGLDYGCGHTPVLSEHLTREHYKMAVYDPVFSSEASVLKKKYNFIVCCEVMEHFYDPSFEFKQLYELLLPNGKLICKTHLYENKIAFEEWYYKNDPSHVFIYQVKTLIWIKNHFRFDDVKIDGRLITFSKYT